MRRELPFAFVMLFEVRADGPDDKEFELLHTESLCVDVMYPELGNDYDEIFDQLEKEKLGEGFYRAYGTGHIEFYTTEGPEGQDHNADVHVDHQYCDPASEGEMFFLKDKFGPSLQWPFEDVTKLPDGPGAFLTITKEDYQQHQHQHAINHLILNDPAYVAESKQTRYKPDQLRLMASAQIRGLNVDLKTGTISVPNLKE